VQINPHTVQVSWRRLSGHLPVQAGPGEWLLPANDSQKLVDGQDTACRHHYPHLSSDEIFHSMEVFYRRFYFRPTKIWEISRRCW